MKLRKLALAIALCAASAPAFAQSTDWAGLYLGVTAGHADGDSDVTTTVVDASDGYFATSSVAAIATAGAGQVDPSGTAYGATIGYNWQSDALVFGLEADWNALNVDNGRDDGAIYPCCAPTAFTIREQTSAEDLVTVRARIGYATNHSLFYFTAGWAQVDIGIEDEFTDDFADAHESFDDSETQDDWIWGIGYEHDIGRNWSLKAEYLRADFGTVSGTSNNLTTDGGDEAWPTDVFTHTADLDLRVIRVGVNYRF